MPFRSLTVKFAGPLLAFALTALIAVSANAGGHLELTFGSGKAEIELNDSAAARDLLSMLPLTLAFEELQQYGKDRLSAAQALSQRRSRLLRSVKRRFCALRSLGQPGNLLPGFHRLAWPGAAWPRNVRTRQTSRHERQIFSDCQSSKITFLCIIPQNSSSASRKNMEWEVFLYFLIIGIPVIWWLGSRGRI